MARPVLFSEIIDSQVVNGDTYVKFTDAERIKLAGIDEGAAAGAAWEAVTGRPESLADLDSEANTALVGKLDKAGGTMTGDITMGTGARIYLNGTPSNANEPISLSYFNTHKERSDFQADVDAVISDPATQFPGDGSLPVAAIGHRYILASVATPHEDWGTIDGGPGDGDIIQYKDIDGTPTWVVVYDVSERGEGVLTWDRAETQWLNYTVAGGWAGHGGLSVYTAGNGLQLIEGVFSVKVDTNTGGNIAPVTVGANGVGVGIDNSTIKFNGGTGQLYADIAVPQGMYTTGFMHKVTELDVSNGYITFPTMPSAMPPIASGQLSSVVITVPGGSPQVNAARSMYVSNNPAPDFSLDHGNLNRIIIRAAQAGGIPLTDSISEGDVLDIVYTTSGS